MSRAGGAARAAGGGEGGRLQAEMLQLDLIDAAGDAPAEEQTAPEPLQKEPPPASTDSYRPKRPTTLNLFPQVPRSQVSAGPGGSPGTGGFCRGWGRRRRRGGTRGGMRSFPAEPSPPSVGRLEGGLRPPGAP